MATLTLDPKQDHLEKIAATRDPIKALAEFVWNALDADATDVSIEFQQNVLGGLDAIVVRDNGEGITDARADHDFKSLGESWKRNSSRTAKLSRAIHGKEGRGRLRFFSLSRRAEWSTVYEDAGKRWQLSLKIDADNLRKCEKSNPAPAPEAPTGTIVVMSPLKDTFDWLNSKMAFQEFATIFAPYLMQYPGTVVRYNGSPVKIEELVAHSHDLPPAVIIGPTRTIRDVSVKIIEWATPVESRKIYLGREDGVVLGSQAAHVTAPGFAFSAYAYSAFFEEMMTANLLEMDDLNEPNFARVMVHIREGLGDYFRGRMAERSSGLIDQLKTAGAYPYEGEPKDEVERRERQVFDIATYAVDSYSRDFKRAETSLKKMTLTLLKEALRHNPDALSRILKAVVGLPKNRQDEFSALLERTELGNIIAASSLIADRVAVLQMLQGIVFDPEHRLSTKERGELDVLVRDNTWLFGENFHIALPEAGLTRVMARVSEELGTKRGGKVRTTSGKIGRIDAFLGRQIPHPQSTHREFLLVELKRPSLKIGRKELDQVEDYVNAIREQPDFLNVSTTWHFYLVSTEYEKDIEPRIRQKDRPHGLFLEMDNATVWVKTWAEIVRDCESRLHFIQDRLKFELPAEEIEMRIAALKTSLIGEKPTP
ncbi:ATP-binding protein [Mesorhizobium sp. M7A.F.Ca.US.001.02.1.1]|uniref:ATP-binding protein n=1 Tax=Mesorhizobium sp. M7A.F.Ca.US.001.02.1.1 TaxID=2496703 RepID=UPI000FD58232|nr:ATP-binding protein [Mesorhizobium sp. M7A.F.Ca.US.001.02.1.1]RUZ98693.1 hypothetical protein EN938_30790 [Mesorhizobium sp. M7A.F.Ca.US.001.02.1.1]